jgi:hypothetical protein
MSRAHASPPYANVSTLVNVDDKGRVPAFVRSNGLVVGNLFVSDVFESSMLLIGQNSSRKWPNELWRGERLVQRLSPQAQESIAMLPRMRFVRAGWWPKGHECGLWRLIHIKPTAFSVLGTSGG